MRKIMLIAGSNLRRAKGQVASIVVLILAASAMMNLWLMLQTDYQQNFRRYHEKLNAGHVTLAVSSQEEALREDIAEILENDERTVEYEMMDALSMVGSFAYNGGEINTEFVILEKKSAQNKSMERIEISGYGDAAAGDAGTLAGEEPDGIYIPMIYGGAGGFAQGDTMELTIGSTARYYTVLGVLNSVMMGSHNCSMSVFLLTKEAYEKLEQDGLAPASTLVSVRIRDGAESEEFEALLADAVSSRYPGVRILSNSYTTVSQSRYISQMICAGILSAMACIVTLIALVVISSGVMNDIQENMKMLGALKAIGYQSRQIIAALLLQYSGLTLPASVLGIALSYALFPMINRMMTAQTGIPYEVHFLPLPCMLSLVLPTGTVALAVWFAARRIRKIEPVTALRQGVQTHSFKRSRVPLDQTRLPLVPALALKAAASGIRQNITVCITMLALSLVITFTGLMLENVIMDMDPFLHMIVGETADSCIDVNVDREDEFLRQTEEDDRVEKAWLYHSEEVRHAGGIALIATMSDDFSDVNNQDVCVFGRFPKYENEVAVGIKYAREQHLSVGDTITLAAEGKEAEYLICGMTQISNNLGKDCLLTREGYERIGTFTHTSYYLNLREGTDIDAFHEEMQERFGISLNATINILAVIEGSSAVYVSLMTMIVTAVLVLGTAVVVFVLWLLVRTMLNYKKREYGILKALGFTTRQLMVQTALSFLPAVTISTVVGIVVSAVVINPLTALFLNGIGIVKCTFAVPVGFITAAGAGLILFAFVTACLMALRIRKIAPVTLIGGE